MRKRAGSRLEISSYMRVFNFVYLSIYLSLHQFINSSVCTRGVVGDPPSTPVPLQRDARRPQSPYLLRRISASKHRTSPGNPPGSTTEGDRTSGIRGRGSATRWPISPWRVAAGIDGYVVDNPLKFFCHNVIEQILGFSTYEVRVAYPSTGKCRRKPRNYQCFPDAHQVFALGDLDRTIDHGGQRRIEENKPCLLPRRSATL
jgi:hypothetical protein